MPIVPILTAILLFQGQTPPAKPAPDKVMVRVNGVPLTAGDVEPYLWDWRANEVLDDLTLLQIAEQAAKKASLTVTQEELDGRIKKELTQLQSGNYDLQKLREQGFPLSRIAVKIRTAILLEKLTLLNFKPEEWAQIGSIDYKPENPSVLTWGKVTHQASETYSKLQKGVLWDKLKPQDAQPDHWTQVQSLPPDVVVKLKTAPAGMVFPPHQNGQAIEIVRLVGWGGNLNAAQQEDLKNFYVQQNRNATLTKLREEAKIERPS